MLATNSPENRSARVTAGDSCAQDVQQKKAGNEALKCTDELQVGHCSGRKIEVSKLAQQVERLAKKHLRMAHRSQWTAFEECIHEAMLH